MHRSATQRAAAERTRNLWIALVLVTLGTLLVNFYKLGDWPWDHDEVPSLVELGVLETHLNEGRLAE